MSQVIWDDDAIPFFGVDVENWKPGKRQVIDAKTAGFPLRSLERTAGRRLPRAGRAEPL